MTIQDAQKRDAQLAGVSATPGADPVRGGEAAHAAGQVSTDNDRVALSALGHRIRGESSDSLERTAYLEQLAAALQKGQYRADPALIANKLIDEALSERNLSPAQPE